MGQHAMIDLETLGVGDNAPIAQIGAVVFDVDGVRLRTGIEINISLTIDPPSVIGTPDMSTLLWWMRQDRQIQKKVFAQDGAECLAVALVKLNRWFYENDVKYVWANSPNFDIRLLQQAYTRAGVDKWPFSHRAELDFRTLRHFGRQHCAPAAPTHSALADAVQQAEDAIKILNAMELKL